MSASDKAERAAERESWAVTGDSSRLNQRKQRPAPKSRGGGNRATRATRATTSAAVVAAQSGRVEILVGTDEHRVNDEAVAVLAGDEDLFARVGMLTRIVGEDAVHDGIVRPNGAKQIRVLLLLLLLQSLRENMTRRIQFVEMRNGI